MTTPYRPCSANELLQQIGIPNLLAISGGRAIRRETGVTLPVSNGYKVEVDLAWDDTWIVRRTFTRSGKVTVKREWTDVYAWDVGEIAYQASCFRNV